MTRSTKPRRSRHSRWGRRSHSNNKGQRQIRTGSYLAPLRRLARELGIPFRSRR